MRESLFLLLLVLCGCGGPTQSEGLLSRLRSRSLPVRLQAIAHAGAHPNVQVQAELLRIFQDEREVPIARGGAGVALGQLHDPRIVPQVLQRVPAALPGPNGAGPASRLNGYLLSRALQAYGPEALPPLADLLKHPRKEVVAWTLLQHGLYLRNDRALEVLSGYLAHREVTFRRAAAHGLAQLGHPGAETVILQHLGDQDPQVRFSLAVALEQCSTAKALPALETQLARESDPKVKARLAQTRAFLNSRSAVPLPIAR